MMEEEKKLRNNFIKISPFSYRIVVLLLLFLSLQGGKNQLYAATNTELKQGDSAKIYKEQIEADGYKYTYEAVPTSMKNDFGEIIYNGKITIRNKDNNIFYEEITDLDPRDGMCGKFPTLSIVPVKIPSDDIFNRTSSETKEWLVVLCGSISGRNQTLKVFRRDGTSGLSSTSLDFGDTVPNLSETADGRGYETKVYRRVLIPGVASGLQSYFMVYKLFTDDSMFGLFGFIPVFGPEIEKPYFDNYMSLKEEVNQKTKNEKVEDKKRIFTYYVGSILSSLIATQDKNNICQEIRYLHSYGLTTNDLLTWIKRIRALGYPVFDVNTCKEGLK